MAVVEMSVQQEYVSIDDQIRLCNERIGALVDELTEIYTHEHREDANVYQSLRQATNEKNILLNQLRK